MPGSDAARRVTARAFTYGREASRSREISVPVETPVEIAYGGVPFAVMLATPSDLEDFAYGFSLTEGVIATAAEVRDIGLTPGPEGVRIELNLAPSSMGRHLSRRRAMTGRTGCGVCGIEDLASLAPNSLRSVLAPEVALEAVGRAVAALEAGQDLNRETRSVHAAGWADRDGRLLHLREDVGRHNALDKLIGCLLRAGIDAREGFVVITSRCSFEMVDKTAALGAGMLVAVSGPTSLALDRAEQVGMALVGIARQDGVTGFVRDGALLTPKRDLMPRDARAPRPRAP